MVETTTNNDGQENSKNGNFAHGANRYNNCLCPAYAAGYDVDTNSSVYKMAKIYDIVVFNKYRESWEGVIPEEVARKAWLEAIDIEYNDVERIGEDIAKEMGWL